MSARRRAAHAPVRRVLKPGWRGVDFVDRVDFVDGVDRGAAEAAGTVAAHPAIPAPHPAIPAKAGIQHNKRALRAPFPRIGVC